MLYASVENVPSSIFSILIFLILQASNTPWNLRVLSICQNWPAKLFPMQWEFPFYSNLFSHISQILSSMHQGTGYSAKTLGKSVFHYQTDWSGNGLASQFWQMESALSLLVNQLKIGFLANLPLLFSSLVLFTCWLYPIIFMWQWAAKGPLCFYHRYLLACRTLYQSPSACSPTWQIPDLILQFLIPSRKWEDGECLIWQTPLEEYWCLSFKQPSKLRPFWLPWRLKFWSWRLDL